MHRRTVIKTSALFALGAFASAGFSSCGNSSQTASKGDAQAPSGPLRVALVPWLGWGQIHIAENKNFFKAEGVEVEQTIFQTVSDANAALLANKADLLWVVAADLVVLSQTLPDLKFILASDYSGEVDAILGTDIQTAEDTEGKKFAREDVPYEVVFMGKYLETLGLTEKDVDILPLAVPEAATALATGKLDAATLYEPFVSRAVKERKDLKVLFSPAGTNIIINGLVARGEAIANRRKDILAYMRALNKGVDFAKANPAEAHELIGKWVGLEGAEVAELMSKVDLLDIEKNKKVAFNSQNKLNVANSIDSAVPILIGAGKITKSAAGASFVDASFVEEL
jgi:NitT/TauT family transport system substrate-binding protein